jgi:hypothetical protein
LVGRSKGGEGGDEGEEGEGGRERKENEEIKTKNNCKVKLVNKLIKTYK